MVPFLNPAPLSSEEDFNVVHQSLYRPGLRTLASVRKWEILSQPIEEECIGACAIHKKCVGCKCDRPLPMIRDPSAASEQESKFTRPSKRPRLENEGTSLAVCLCRAPAQIETGIFRKIPPELFHHIFKFLSSEDLISCSLACKFLNFAASDESLWRRLYYMCWGLSSPYGKLRACAWKKLTFRITLPLSLNSVNSGEEFLKLLIHAHLSIVKRHLPSVLGCLIEKDPLRQIPENSNALLTCSYSQIGDVFLCDKTGRVHVCDETCRETILDPDGLVVCTISGHCFDRLLSPCEEETTALVAADIKGDFENFKCSTLNSSPVYLNGVAVAQYVINNGAHG
ncbi:F-box protein SKIP31-like [Aristolochia californica]|uniref:F-box protein SKIP31-like n=1 Tax=Aristolochia californica TaxID=171875 RepID=UPI0035E023F5